MKAQPIKILLIDKHESDRARLYRSLTDACPGILLFEASDCESGLAQFKTLVPDCVVLELKQDDMLGIEILNLIKSEMAGKPVPMFVWTRLNHEVLRSVASTLGIQGYFSKATGSELNLTRAILDATGEGKR